MENRMYQVDGVWIKTPSEIMWGEIDIRSEDSGRTLDAVYHKNEIAKKVVMTFLWFGINEEDTANVLTAFDPQYFSINYLDPKTNSRITKEFKAGDRSGIVGMIYKDGVLYQDVSLTVTER